MARRGTSSVCDVLIVGAGPVGLAAALLLARQGLACTLIDRRAAPHGAPRAHAINPRTLEICRALGFERDEFSRQATPTAQGARVRFMTRLGGRELGSLPYERQDPAALEFTPEPLLNIAQPAFEQVLLAHVAAEPRIDLRRGCRWLGATQEQAGVVSQFAHEADRTDGEIASRYLIGADGARSGLRQALGIGMSAPGTLQHRLMIHFRADLGPLLADRPAAMYWNLDPAAPGGFIAYDLHANWVYMYRYDPALQEPRTFSSEQCAALVREAIDGDAGPIEILHRSPWVLSVQLAERYRRGRMFLAGDAAHCFPPTGGLGLNTGIQDVHNLAWKIAAVERGWAGRALLDSYESERRPIAEVNARHSAENGRNMGRVFAFIEELAGAPAGLDAKVAEAAVATRLGALIAEQSAHFDSIGLQLGFSYGADGEWTRRVSRYVPSTAVGVRMPHAWILCKGARVSTLDLVRTDRFTLFTAGDDRWRRWAAACAIPVNVAALGETFDDPSGAGRSVLELRPEGALLVRPDGHVAGTQQRADGVALLGMSAALEQAAGIA